MSSVIFYSIFHTVSVPVGRVYGEQWWWHAGVLDMGVGRLLMELLRVACCQIGYSISGRQYCGGNVGQQAWVGSRAALHEAVVGLPEAEHSRSGGNFHSDSP